MNVVVIGAGAAGVTAAAEIRKRDKDAEITILEKGSHYTYSPCSLPYVISGEIDKEDITTFDIDFFRRNKIHIQLETEVEKVDKDKKKVYAGKEFSYDYLVIATGSSTFIPPIKGLEDAEYYKLKTIEDANRILEKLDSAKKAVIIGGGVIGMELAGSLKKLGLEVTVVEAADQILGSILDKRMAKRLQKKLDIKFFTNTLAKQVNEGKLISENNEIPYDLLVVVCGVRPNIRIAKQAGIDVDKGIVVNENMHTSAKDVYACGDCIYKKGVAWLGTNAVLEAQVVAKNICGEKTKLRKLHNTTITHVGDLTIASTGEKSGKSFTYTGESRAEYCPLKKEITVKLTAEDGRVSGAQIIGEEAVLGRINWIALAVQNKMGVEKLANAESAYNPMTSPLFDPVVVAAKILLRKIDG